jgi:hypothetical protein
LEDPIKINGQRLLGTTLLKGEERRRHVLRHVFVVEVLSGKTVQIDKPIDRQMMKKGPSRLVPLKASVV